MLKSQHQYTWMILLALPFVALLILMAQFNVAVPFSDDLYMAPYLERIVAGDVLAATEFQLNEHRAFISLVLNGLVAATGTWNIKLLLLVNPALAAVIVYILHRMGRKTMAGIPRDEHYFLAFTVAILATSLSFWEVWSHIFTLNLTLANASFLVAVLVLFTDRNEIRALLVATLMCLIASFSAIHGLLAWPALLPLMVARSWSFTSKWWLVPGAAVLLWVGVISLYLSGYETPSTPVDIWYLVREPFSFMYFLVISIGAPVFDFSLNAAAATGAGLLLGVVWFFYKAFKDGVSWLRISPWVSVWLFGLGSTLALAIGRAGAELPWRATQSRFGLLTYFIPMTFLYMLYLAYRSNVPKRKWNMVLILGVVIALIIASGLYDLQLWEGRSKLLQEGRACIQYYETAPEECLEKLGNGITDGEAVRSFIPAIERLGGF